MSKRFITVLESLSAPPRADFFCSAVRSGNFETSELINLFGRESMEATLELALEYIEAGSILVLSSKREEYLELLSEVAASDVIKAPGLAVMPSDQHKKQSIPSGLD
jgi:hypothetical protein